MSLFSLAPMVMLYLTLFVSIAFTTPKPWDDWDGAVHVTAGGSIQAAIDAAYPGQTIVVEAGTYAEQLTVATDGVQVIGKGAILEPPAAFSPNTCSGLAGPGSEAGICVTGQGIVLADFVVEHRKVLSVGQPVRGVTVAGFEVKGFAGLNIAIVGGVDVTIAGNTLYDGGAYGCLTAGSKHTNIDNNDVASTADLLFIAICMDDISDVQVTNNHIDNYAIGLCVQTNGAYVAGNAVTNACWGVFVDPGVLGAQITDNHISNGNLECIYVPQGGIDGVIIYGSSHTTVQGNLIEHITSGGSQNVTGTGIIVVDDPDTGDLTNGNAVMGNILKDNDIDILLLTNGTGNVIEGNQCATPTALCATAFAE